MKLRNKVKYCAPPRPVRWLLYPVILVIRLLHACYLKTLHFECVHFELFAENLPPGKTAVYVLWNSKCLFLTPYLPRARIKYLTFFDFKHWFLQKMISMKDDQRLVYQESNRMIFHIITELKNGRSVVLAGDGPYGPPGILKEGAIYLGSRAQVPVIAMKVEVSRSFRLKWRWDQFEIAWPFSKVTITAIPHTVSNGRDLEVLRKGVGQSLGDY